MLEQHPQIFEKDPEGKFHLRPGGKEAIKCGLGELYDGPKSPIHSRGKRRDIGTFSQPYREDLMFRGVLILSLLLALSFRAAVADDATPVLKVGVIIPLSGVSLEYGEAIHNCIDMARSDNPAQFSKIRFIFEDAQYDAQHAISAFQKLKDVDRVDMIYTWGVLDCRVLAPLAEASQIPMVGQCIDRGAAAGRKFVMRFMNYTDQYLQKTLQYLYDHGRKKLAVVPSENSYQEAMFDALNRNLLPGQTVTVIDRYQADQMNLRSTVAKLRSSDYDAVGVFLLFGQVAQFYKQLREQNAAIPTFGTNVFEGLAEVRAAGGAMDGAVFSNNEIHPEFLARYIKTYGKESHLAFGAPAYEFASVLGELFGDGERPDKEKILSGFASVKVRPGIAAGPYSFREVEGVGRFMEFPLVMKRIEGEHFRVL